MIETKMIEVRDSATCIPALALKMASDDPVEYAFLASAGFPQYRGGRDTEALHHLVVLIELRTLECRVDQHDDWSGGARTMPTAHGYISEHFDELANGAVVDVRVILGEASEPAEPEVWRG